LNSASSSGPIRKLERLMLAEGSLGPSKDVECSFLSPHPPWKYTGKILSRDI
jgi:hypothetical protein